MSTSSRSSRDDVVVISGARRSGSEDHHQRVRNYLISMAIRTVSVVLLVVVPKPWGWIFLATAVFLPYIAVVGGNATDQRGESSVLGYHDPQKLLGPGRDDSDDADDAGPDPRRSE